MGGFGGDPIIGAGRVSYMRGAYGAAAEKAIKDEVLERGLGGYVVVPSDERPPVRPRLPPIDRPTLLVFGVFVAYLAAWLIWAAMR